MTRICLTMIVKDEAHVIERCLESVAQHIDYWVIIDTGSTDGTQDIVRSFMKDYVIPGELIERPWVNFGYNRTEALSSAQITRVNSECDYALWIDADEVLVGDSLSTPDGLTLDGYSLQVDYAGVEYGRLCLTNLDKPWKWVGPVHEYLELENAETGTLDSPRVLVRHDGARSKDPETYVKDGLLLKAALDEDPDNTRLRFYYAQSLRDGGRAFDAREEYRKRTEMGGWDEEVYISYLNMGRINEQLGEPGADDYLDAANLIPARAEAWVELARVERLGERYEIGYLYADRAIDCVKPENGLFVETAAYGWRAYDEYALCAWYSGHKRTALVYAQTAAGENPDDDRLKQNVILMS